MKFGVLAMVMVCMFCNVVSAKTQRSAAEVLAFKPHNPYPSTHLRRGACPGHVIDHISALACGGPDTAQNMQWQTIAEGKAKDK